MAPLGCKVVIHDQPGDGGTWDSHGTLAYYINVAEKHYRNYKYYILKTNTTQISDIVEFFPKLVQIPKTSSKDRLTAVLEDLKEVLKHSHPNTSFLDKGTTTNTTIEKLDTILGPPKKYHNDLSRVIRVESPRVLRNNQPPRVAQTNQQQLATIAEEPTIYPSGTIIRKKIGRTLQIGTVTRYDDDREYYWINYKNGDSEEMQHQFVTKYKCIEPDILQRRSN